MYVLKIVDASKLPLNRALLFLKTKPFMSCHSNTFLADSDLHARIAILLVQMMLLKLEFRRAVRAATVKINGLANSLKSAKLLFVCLFVFS